MVKTRLSWFDGRCINQRNVSTISKRDGSWSIYSFALAGLILVLIIFAMDVHPVHAQDPEFQSFFSDVCTGSPTGSLATRCAETPGAGGNLSSDSENSLNPSQPLSSNERPVARAREESGKIQKHAEALREGDAKEQNMSGTFSTFVNGRGSWFDRDAGTTERGFDGETWGIDVGLDYRFSRKTVVGMILSYEQTDSDFDADQPGVNFAPASNEGETEADSYIIGIFGTYNFSDDFFIEGNAGVGFTDYTFTRTVVFQESTRTMPQTNVRTDADTDGTQVWVSSGLGYDFHNEALSFGPYVRATYIRSEIDEYTEKDRSDSGLQMTINVNDRESLTTDIGAMANYSISMNWGVLVPHAYIEWEHEFDNDAQVTTATYVLDSQGNTFSLQGDDPDRNYVNAGAGLVSVLPNGWQVLVNYEGLIAYRDLDSSKVTAGVRKEF